jgi:hypothetical protein
VGEVAVLVSPELVSPGAAQVEVVAQLVVAVVAEQALVAEQGLRLLPLVLLLWPHPDHRQAQQRLCSLRQCRPLYI